jgi:ankyrin repeat protein
VLMMSIKEGKTKVASLLIKEGAKVDLRNDYGDSALILSASSGYTEIVS